MTDNKTKADFIVKHLALSDTGLCETLGISEEGLANLKNNNLTTDTYVDKINKLFEVATTIASSNITITPYILLRRRFRGRTLMELLIASSTEVDAPNGIIHQLRKEAEQHNKIRERLVNRPQAPISVSAYGKPRLYEQKD